MVGKAERPIFTIYFNSTNTKINQSHTPTGMGFFYAQNFIYPNLYITIEDILMIKGLAITPPVLGRI
ncbi:MAG: hypothetical protein RSC68_14300, partial [Acinetobacter sp.]